MGNKRFVNSDAEARLDFLNERVINNKKNNFFRLITLLVLLSFILLTVVGIVYVCVKPGFSLPFFKNNFNKDIIKSSLEEIKESFTTKKPEEETTNKEAGENQIILNDMSPSDVSRYSICSIGLEDKVSVGNNDKLDFLGSGVVISIEDTINILSYYENVADYEEVLVRFSNSNEFIGKVSRLSKDYGISLIEVEKDGFSKTELEEIKPVNISYKSDYSVGKELYFIGASKSADEDTLEKNTVIEKGSLTLASNTVSIIDAQLRIISTDIIPNNVDNGFLFDEKGSLYAIMNKSNYLRRDMGSYITIDSVELYLDSLLNENLAPYIGIYGQDVTDEVINNIDSQMPLGIYISKVKNNSPAYNSGIVHGDVVVSINGKEIKNFSDYNEELSTCNVGDEIEVVVMRKGKEGYKRIEYKIVVGGLK
ncbi:MAG: serine protease [Lachnospiraceae bacterium]|nr:serine protease [Lachnospiraceae bacterium]